MRAQRLTRSHRNHPESGQTILLVALAIVSLLGMAALAIDVVTLYVARSETQRATDAAALAGAKAVADSGFTTLATGDTNYASAKTLARTMAIQAVNAVVTANPPVNLVAGSAPQLVGSPTVDTSRQGNVLVSVTLIRSNLPTFFSKIFGRTAATVSTTAVAEAYNPSNNSTFTPVAPLSLKPWLVANIDPNTGSPFIDPATGNVNAATTVVGETFDLTPACGNNGFNCTSLHGPGTYPSPSLQVDYVPLQVTANTKNVCPSSCLGPSDYERSIECADVNTYVAPSCGGGVANSSWDNGVNPRHPARLSGPSAVGAECLIHATGPGPLVGQDTLDTSGWPLTNRMKITAHSGAQSGKQVTASDSIVTIPIMDQTSFSSANAPVRVIGYIQAFINWVEPVTNAVTTRGDINVTVLNIAGCSNSPNAAPPVVGGAGTSPVPVRLITPP